MQSMHNFTRKDCDSRHYLHWRLTGCIVNQNSCEVSKNRRLLLSFFPILNKLWMMLHRLPRPLKVKFGQALYSSTFTPLSDWLLSLHLQPAGLQRCCGLLQCDLRHPPVHSTLHAQKLPQARDELSARSRIHSLWSASQVVCFVTHKSATVTVCHQSRKWVL